MFNVSNFFFNKERSCKVDCAIFGLFQKSLSSVKSSKEAISALILSGSKELSYFF